jgi:hypothetical protein
MSVDEVGLLTDLEVGASRPPRSLGMWAVLTGVVTAEQLQEAYAEWDERGEAPGEMFVRRGWMTEQMVADALGELSGLPVVRDAQRSQDADVSGALSADEAWRLEACPLERDAEGKLVVALADPSDARLRALESHLGSIRPVIVVNSELRALLDGMQAAEAEAAPDDQASSRTTAAQDGGEPDTEAHDGAPSSPPVEAAGRLDVAPERVDSQPVMFPAEPAADPAAATERLQQLHERLVSEHVQATDELVAFRRQLKALGEEQARVQQSIAALEAQLGEGELVLSLIKAKLTELAQPASGR